MKKFIALLVVAVMAIGMFSISVLADNSKLPGGYVFGADLERGSEGHYKKSSSMDSAETTENGVVLDPKEGSSAYTTFFSNKVPDELSMFDVKDYPICVVGIKVDGDMPETNGEKANGYILMKTTTDAGSEAKNKIALDYADTKDWQVVAYDFSSLGLDGGVKSLKFYPSSVKDNPNVTFTIGYFAFFKTMAEVEVLKNDYNGDLAAYILAGGEATQTPSQPEQPEQPTTAVVSKSIDRLQGVSPTIVDDASSITIKEGEKVIILGWAITSEGLSDTKYAINGGASVSFTPTRARADVLTAISYAGPALVAADKVGIGTDTAHAEIDTTGLKAGNHTIKLIACTNSGAEVEYFTINLTVEGQVDDPNTGDFGLIALAFAAVSSVVIKKRKNEI